MRLERMGLLAALALAAAGGLGCNARRGEPLTGAVPIDEPTVARGRTVFLRQCYQCHPGGEAGVGPALNDKPLPRLWARHEIRHSFGPMPAFSKSKLSDGDLKDLMTYLATLRRYDDRASGIARP